MSSSSRRQRRSQRPEALTEAAKRPIYVYIVVYAIIGILIIGLLSLFFTSPIPPTH